MITAGYPLSVDDAEIGLPLVAHGRPARLLSLGKVRKNAKKEGGYSRAITLAYEDEVAAHLTLTIPSPHVHERLLEREAYAQVETAYQNLLEARRQQQLAQQRYGLAEAEFPQVFEAISAKAAANAQEQATARAVREVTGRWINEHEVDPGQLPGGLTAKTFTQWVYEAEFAATWSLQHQPGLLRGKPLDEEAFCRLIETPDGRAALTTLMEMLPDYFGVDDERLQKLLAGADNRTRAAMCAVQQHEVKVQISSTLGKD